jgi:glycosyltransferase involved in cell wall biosynthesis
MSGNKEITPLLSIICPAYNHEMYIAQALDGFVMQKTNFPFEIIVHDDASSDGTVRIMRDYEAKYPHLFRNIYQKENQFSKNIMSVAQNLFNASKGKYIACCDGDDYWTDPFKLQKQVDFLEAYPASAGCFHHSFIIDKNNEELNTIYNPYVSKFLSYNQEMALTWLGSSYATCSLVFRSSILLNLPNWYKEDACDEFLDILITHYGSLDFIDQTMSVYRITGAGTWTGLSNTQKAEVLLNRTLVLYNEDFFRAKYSNFLIKKIKNLSIELTYDKSLKRKKRFRYFSIALKFIEFNSVGHFLFVIRFLIDPIYNIALTRKLVSLLKSSFLKRK